MVARSLVEIEIFATRWYGGRAVMPTKLLVEVH
jgi:hypothetical protein